MNITKLTQEQFLVTVGSANQVLGWDQLKTLIHDIEPDYPDQKLAKVFGLLASFKNGQMVDADLDNENG